MTCSFSLWANTVLSSRTRSAAVCRLVSATTSPPINKRRLDVAIVGLPNAGKSQLLNVLTQSTVSAVSRKRHTTRHGVLGARTVRNTQLLFLDTPGFLRARDAKREGLPDREHLAEPSALLPSVDHTLLVVDAARNLTDPVKRTLIELMLLALQAKGRDELRDDEDDDDDDDDDDLSECEREEGAGQSEDSDEEELLLEEPATLQGKLSIVLNKVDLVHPKEDLLDLASDISSLTESCVERMFDGPADELEDHLPMFFYVSALKEDGTDDLLQYLLDLATPSVSWEVDPNASTNLTPEERVEEIVREKIYRCLHKEVPYRIQQRNTLFRVVKDPNGRSDGRGLGVVAHQEIIVRSKSHVELVRGTGGQNLERIRSSAERDLQRIFGCKVVLQLHVKLNKSKSWTI